MQVDKIFKNSFFSVLSQIVLIIVGFFSQRVMNLRVGQELVGLNSVISNIIALLSVSELGIATAVVYHLYGALENNDEEQIASLMNLYRRAYFIFALFITTAGLLLLPFIHLFLKENSFALSYVRLVYLLWLIRTVLSYLLSYRRSILIADQREYIVSITLLAANVMNYGSIILILELSQDYVIALSINILVEAVSNIWLSRYVDRKYPFLKRLRKKASEKSLILRVFHDIKNIFVTRLSNKLLNSTTSLIISSFISVSITGLYSNYTLITQSVINVMNALSNAIQPSVGHMFIAGDKEKDYRALRKLSFLFFFVTAVVGSCLYSLITPFVTDIWLTDQYRLDTAIVLFCVMSCCLLILGLPLALIMNVSGLFEKERNLSILTAVVNLLLALLLIKPLGIVGVLIGSCSAYALQLLFRTYYFFRYYLKESPVRYFTDMILYILLITAEIAGTAYISSLIYQRGSFARFILILLLCAILPCLCNLLFYLRDERLISLFHTVRGLKKRSSPDIITGASENTAESSIADTILLFQEPERYFFPELGCVYAPFAIRNMKLRYWLYLLARRIPLFRLPILYGPWKKKLPLTKQVILFDFGYLPGLERYIHKRNPSCQVYLYYWNIIQKNHPGIRHFTEREHIYSTDKADCKTYHLKYNHIFYPGPVNMDTGDSKHLFFMGLDKKRGLEIKELKNILENAGIHCDIRLYSDSRDPSYRQSLSDLLVDRTLNYADYCNCLRSCGILLDYNQPGQTSLSMRVMEAIYFSKKLITTNTDIVNYDFYDPDKILVLSRPFDELSPTVLKDFAEKPFVPYGGETLYNYSFAHFKEQFTP